MSIISKLTYSGAGQSNLNVSSPTPSSLPPALPLLCSYSFTHVGWITRSTVAFGQGRQQAGPPLLATLIPTARKNSLVCPPVIAQINILSAVPSIPIVHLSLSNGVLGSEGLQNHLCNSIKQSFFRSELSARLSRHFVPFTESEDSSPILQEPTS
jgi:hypothetical protein